ncbi:MAG: hypothetical protein ACKO1U_02670 [Bacteroidota bacterium]
MNRQLNRLTLLCLFLLQAITQSCMKEADAPQWDIEVLGPVVNATLGMDQLIADSLQAIGPDGKVRLVLDQLIDNFASDSVYTIPDTGIRTIYTWDFFPFSIPPGTPFFTNNKNILLNVKGAQLTDAIIRKGEIRLTARNTLPTRVYFTYTIPEARKNGMPFTFSASVDSGSFTHPTLYSTTLDFSGYDVNLTGATHDLVNTFAYNVLARSDSAGQAFSVNPGDTLLDITTDLLGINPRYVKGYIGQKTLQSTDTFEIGIGSLFQSGQLRLDSATLNLRLENSVGADIQAYIQSLQSVNSRTGTTIDLIATDVLRRNLNINRASETGNSGDPVRPTVLSLSMDNSNSNLNAFLQNLPDKIITELNYSLNPLANISGNNDFIFDDRLISTRVNLQIPLRLSTSALTLMDTLEFSIKDFTDFSNVKNTLLTVVADNGFPFEMKLQLYPMDASFSIMDSLLVPDRIAPAMTDVFLRVTDHVTTSIDIPIDENRKSRILQSPYLLVKASFTSSGSPDYLDLYSDYSLRFKLLFDGTYGIR